MTSFAAVMSAHLRRGTLAPARECMPFFITIGRLRCNTKGKEAASNCRDGFQAFAHFTVTWSASLLRQVAALRAVEQDSVILLTLRRFEARKNGFGRHERTRPLGRKTPVYQGLKLHRLEAAKMGR